MKKFMNSHFDEKKWMALSFYSKMGNIGSEVGRTMNALKNNDLEAAKGAYYRGLDLIDATAKSLPRYRCQELLRARELFSEAFENKTVDQKLDNYFMTFAVLARM